MIKFELRSIKSRTPLTREIVDARFERCHEGMMMTSWYLNKYERENGGVLCYMLYDDGTVEWSVDALNCNVHFSLEYEEELNWFLE